MIDDPTTQLPQAFDEGNLRFSHVIKYLVAPAHLLDRTEGGVEGDAAAGRCHAHHPGWEEQQKVRSKALPGHVFFGDSGQTGEIITSCVN